MTVENLPYTIGACQFEDATDGVEVERKEKLKTKWAQVEAIVGGERRIVLVAGGEEAGTARPPPGWARSLYRIGTHGGCRAA